MRSLILILCMQTASAVEVVTYFHNDALGSPIAATDTTGKLLWKEDYQPYGNRIRKQNTDTNQQWYTGKHHEADIGLSYFGARWYDPTLGRFMAVDPVGFKETNIHSHNRYAYANNNPYLFVDPDGRESVDSVKERLRTGKTLRHPAGGSSSSFPATMNPVPGFSPPMSSAELAVSAASIATGVGAIRQGIKWGLGKFVTKGVSKSASEMADDLASQIGKNSVGFRTPNKTGNIDLRGRSHFDKRTQTEIPMPHVQTRDIKVGLNGQISVPRKTEITRSATIDLIGTSLENKVMDTISINCTEDDWINCSVSDNQFKAYGGPENLEEILNTFKEWVVADGVNCV